MSRSLALLSISVLVGCADTAHPAAQDLSASAKFGDKVEVCHQAEHGAVALSVSAAAVDAHLDNHGDWLVEAEDGSCDGVDEDCDGELDEDCTPEDDVLELAVRRLDAGQDLTDFEDARDAFVDLLTEVDGVGTDREFEAVLDFATFGAPEPAVFTGMTQYDDLVAFADAGAAVGSSDQALAFFGTFTAEAFTLLQPLDGGAVDLAGIAPEADDVLEIAVRDLGDYADFDADAYATARDAFLDLLTAQSGVVAEYQWVSVSDPEVVVGMTVYDDLGAFYAVASDPAVAGSPAAAAFVGGYPPSLGFLHAVVR